MKIMGRLSKQPQQQIKIKYHGDVAHITKQPNGDWYDLRTEETVYLMAGQYYNIPLGVSMILPDGYEAIIIPRSSTFKNYGVLQANGVGLIDNSYSGTNDIWNFPVYATRLTTIPKNTRICQFRIQECQKEIEFIEQDTLNDQDRGGFGTSGRN